MVIAFGVSCCQVVLLENKGLKKKVMFTKSHSGNADSVVSALRSIAVLYNERYDPEGQVAIAFDSEFLEAFAEENVSVDWLWRSSKIDWVFRSFKPSTLGSKPSAKSLAAFAVNSLCECIRRELESAVNTWFNARSKSDDVKTESKESEDAWVEVKNQEYFLSAALFRKPKGGRKLHPSDVSISFSEKCRFMHCKHNLVEICDSRGNEVVSLYIDAVTGPLSSAEAFLGHVLRVSSALDSLYAVSKVLEALEDALINWDKVLNYPLFRRRDSSVFSLAGYAGSFEISKLLFQKGGDPSKKVALRRNIFQFAVLDGQLDICKLYAKHPRVNVNSKCGKTQGTILHECIWRFAKLDMVELLLSLGIDIKVKSKFGETALDVAKVRLEQAEHEDEKEQMARIVELLES